MMVWEKNEIAEAMIDRDKFILPPLNIELSLLKQFGKVLNKEWGHRFPVQSMEKANDRYYWSVTNQETHKRSTLPRFNKQS